MQRAAPADPYRGYSYSPSGLPKHDRLAMMRVTAFAVDPFAPHSEARSLAGQPVRVRIRHGDWRAVCLIDRAARVVTLERVAHRREVYR
jgi:mRNA interferase RelE/StbE